MTLSPVKSILLIDDDEISNLFNKIFIAKLGDDVEVDTALNGQQGLDFLTNDDQNGPGSNLITPCLLLLDVKMPVMDGWQFIEQYDKVIPKKIKDKIVIVMLTTSKDEGDMIKAKNNLNIREFIQKPLSEKKFAEIINKYFDRETVVIS